MDKKNKTITCKDCGKEFIFSIRDQLFYEEMGFNNEPVRCKDCRNKKNNRIQDNKKNEQ